MVNAVAVPQVPRRTAPTLIFVEQSHWRIHEGPILPVITPRLLILLLGFFPNMDQKIVLPEVSIQNQAWNQTLEAILALEATRSMMSVTSVLWANFLLVVLLLLNQILPHQMM